MILMYNFPAKGVSKGKLIAAHALQPIATVFAGSLCFIPYNLFAKSGPPYDMLPWDANIQMAALIHVITFSLAGWLLLVKWRKPVVKERDELLMVFPMLYLAGHAYMYIAKFDLFFSVTEDGLTQGLAVGNLFGVILAIVFSMFMVLASHPPENRT